LTQIRARYEIILFHLIIRFIPLWIRVLILIPCLTVTLARVYCLNAFLNGMHVVTYRLLLIASHLLLDLFLLFHGSLLHHKFLSKLLLWSPFLFIF